MTDDPTSDVPDIDLTLEEERLLDMYRQLPKQDQQTIRHLIDRMSPSGQDEPPAKQTVHAPQQSYGSGKSRG